MTAAIDPCLSPKLPSVSTCVPPKRPSAINKQVGHVVLMVNHHDPVGTHTDRTLGMVIVDTATALQAPGISTQDWFPVRKGPGMKAGDTPQGKVHVKVCLTRVRVPVLYISPPA